jgi:hypothetical protein
MTLVFTTLIFIGLAFQAAVLHALFRGPLRRLPALIGYMIVLFMTTVVDATAYFNGSQFRAVFREYYWIDEVLRKVSLFILVLSLIASALAGSAQRARTLTILALGSLLIGSLSAWSLYHPGERPSRWMTDLVRNLAFFASILNLILWFMMIRARKTQSELLLISGGLGLETTGEAIAQSVRPFVTRATIWIPNMFIILLHLACLLIWWRALQRSNRAHGALASDRDRAGVTSL